MKYFILPGLDGATALRYKFAQAFTDVNSVEILTYPNNKFLNYDGLVSHVEDQLPKSSQFCIIAESFSGPIAIRIASKHQPNLMGIVFVGSFAKCPIRLAKLYTLLVPAFSQQNAIVASLGAALLLGSWRKTDLFIELRRVFQLGCDEVIRQRMMLVLSVDDVDALSELKIPMIYLQAKRDWLVRPRSGAIMHRANPRIKVVILSGPHFLLGAIPDECAAVVEEFIAEQ